MVRDKAQAETGVAATKAALIAAALKLFGENGYAATSTREVAGLAKANIGSIAYYFGGKAGLHRACGEEIGMRMQRVFAPIATSMATQADWSPEKAKSLIVEIFRGMGTYLLRSPEAEGMVAFMLREMAHPGEAFNAVYQNMIEPIHKQLSILVGLATGKDPESPETLLLVFSMIGQLMYFRIASVVVTKRLGKLDYSSSDIDQILAVIEINIIAQLDAGKVGPS
jgi:AcrR family transcriptional regulator